MAEGDEAGQTDQQVQRHGQQPIGHDVNQEVSQCRLGEDERQRDEQRKQQRPDADIAQESGPHHAGSRPSRPLGLMMRTRAIMPNMIPSTNSGNPMAPNARVKPMRIAAISAPTIEPMPPITVTMKLSIRIDRPIPGVSVRVGAARAPAIPASALPTPKIPA